MSEHFPMLAMLAADATGHSPAARLLESTLDMLPAKVVIVDTEAHIVHANAGAAAMLADGDPIWSRHGRLNAITAAATVALIGAITSFVHRSPRVGNEVALPSRDGRPAIAHMRSLDVPPALTPSRAGKAVAIFIVDREAHAPAPVAAIARLFDLTPAEVRVLQQIAAGRNRKQSALALGLADSTVKSHLDHLYQKTGTSDQITLRRLVGSFSWPVIGASP